MKDTAPSPSRLLTLTAGAAQWILGLVIAAWLLFALAVAVLHGWIVPRIGEYRGLLEAQATRAIGVPVRIGAIRALPQDSWFGVFPAIELRDVVLQDAQQREALRLARVVASVSPRSVWKLGFEQLYIERPELDVRMDAAGKLHVAGLAMSTETSGESRAADWLFSQRELAVQGGTVRWTDERIAAPPLLLTEVRFLARNGARRHALRLDATPPAEWGERFTLQGDFRQPLLSTRSGNWHQWDGQLYADLPRMDVSRIGRYVALDARVRAGSGAVRAWLDLRKGELTGATADLRLAEVDATLAEGLAPLQLRSLSGRIAGSRRDQTLEAWTRELQFDTRSGQRWPGGNLWLQHRPALGRTAEQGALRADRLDLALLAHIADSLPLGEALHRQLLEFAPQGVVERIDLGWNGPLEAPVRYQAKGRVSALALAARPAAVAPDAAPGPARAGRPGVRGATIDFEATQAGGSATLSIAQGALDFPGVFEDPVIPLDQLSAQAQWKIDGRHLALTMPQLRFSNADAQGEARLEWHTAEAATGSTGAAGSAGTAAAPAGGGRFPGVLDLSGQLTRADGTRVFRYLPQHIPQPTRDYVRDAVQKGRASKVEFRVRGDLRQMPFLDPRQGEFRIAATVSDVDYAYVPHAGQGEAKAPSPWPALTGLSGELVFERAGMWVRNARGRLAGAEGIVLQKGEAEIPDMAHHAAQLKVQAQARGPLSDALRVAAAVLGPGGEAAAHARASGSADYRLKLEMPLAQISQTKVQAGIALADNELQVQPGLPSFTQVRGSVNFTESGFSLAGVRARLAGGEIRLEGRGRYAGAQPHEMSFHAQGNASAEGLRAAHEIDWLARLGRRMSGATTYAADFSLRDGVPEFSLTSNLQGLALQLPAPLAKAADEAMPLRVEKKVVLREARADTAARLRDQLALDLGGVASVRYLRDIAGAQAQVIAGTLTVAGGLRGAPDPMPEQGVLAHIDLPRFDVDAWKALLGDAQGAAAGASGAADAAEGEAAWGYLPTVIALHAQEVRAAGRRMGNVVLGGTRAGPLWRFNVDADEMSGYVEYRQSQGGQLRARLARLKIAPGEAAQQVESFLDERSETLPALDIVIENFEMNGRHLGRAEIDAVNRGGATREWRLNRLALTTPEAVFSAQGGWAAVPGAGHRRTAMDFRLDITDAGALLARLGMQDVLKRGHGRLEGAIGWRGSPFSIDYPSMEGQLHVDVETGQFLKADPGLAKLLGVLSLQALPRRLTLDFRDVFSQGFAFDFVRGDARIARGVASTNNLQMKGVSAGVLLSGSADIVRETQDLRVVVVPEINAGTAALVATAINPAIGIGTFLAQLALRRPLIAAATQEFHVNGTWADPKIAKVARSTPAPDAGAPGGQSEPIRQ